MQLLRNPTFISLAEPDIFTTIEGLLWQAGLDNLLQNLLEKKLLPHSHYLRLWGYFFVYTLPVAMQAGTTDYCP